MFAALALATFPVAPLSSTDGSATETLEARLLELRGDETQPAFPGASFAAVLPDGTELSVAVGVDDLNDARALTTTDRFLAGSTGKTYFAAATLLLAGQGKLDLDQRAAEYLPDEPVLARLPNGEDVTLRQLLRHQSGMPRYVFAPELWEQILGEPDKVWRPQELLSYVADADPLFPAGEGWAYADTNYLVIGLVLEAVTGSTPYELVEKLVLEPNDLADTIPSDQRDIAGLVQGHVVMARAFGVPARVLVGDRMVFNPQFEGCGGGYATTPLDLARWARRYASEDSVVGDLRSDLLDTVPAPALGPERRYGLGLIEAPTSLGPALGHDGFMPGYLTTMAWFPEKRIAAALQLNTDNARALGKPAIDVLAEMVEILVDSQAAAAPR